MNTKWIKRTFAGIAMNAISLAPSLLPSMCEQNLYSSESAIFYEIPKNMNNENLEDIVKLQRDNKYRKKAMEQNSDKIVAPYYRSVPSGYCSKYAIKASKNLFGKEFVSQDAWNLRYKNKVVDEIDSIGEIKELIIDDKLTPGMIVGVYNPKSNKNRRKDLERHRIKYSHVVVYAGINKEFEPEFIQQYGRRIEKLTLNELIEKGLTPKEIIDVSKELASK